MRRLQSSECLPTENESQPWARPSHVVIGSSVLIETIPSDMLNTFLQKSYLRQAFLIVPFCHYRPFSFFVARHRSDNMIISLVFQSFIISLVFQSFLSFRCQPLTCLFARTRSSTKDCAELLESAHCNQATCLYSSRTRVVPRPCKGSVCIGSLAGSFFSTRRCGKRLAATICFSRALRRHRSRCLPSCGND